MVEAFLNQVYSLIDKEISITQAAKVEGGLSNVFTNTTTDSVAISMTDSSQLTAGQSFNQPALSMEEL